MRATPKIKIYKKTIPILFVAFALVVGACSHSSQSESPPTITLSDEEWEKVVTERSIKAVEIKRARPSGDPSGLEDFPNYDFTPNTPEWNTAVVREAEKQKKQVVIFNNCSSLDIYYDFENFSTGIIEKITEINLRYLNEFRSIVRWSIIANSNLQANNPLNNFDISNLPEEDRARFENLPQTELESIENFGQFYAEVRTELADIIGGRTLRSLVVDITHVTIPLLKEDFASVGIESGRLEPSKFQDMWEENPELEEYAKDYLEFIENTEIELNEFLNENDGVISNFISMPIYDSISPITIQERDPVVDDLIFSTQDTLEESFSKQLPTECLEANEF